jgi:ABC-type multidrug transport system ATPase subunit/ABC-type multidrug transport system permease subunit
MLNVLAGRTPPSQKLEGEVRVNGKRLESRYFKAFSGFVTQDDVMHPFLTVEETVRFYARLRLPGTMTRKEKDTKVDEVLTLLGLNKCRKTIIGNSIVRGISGGERKRVNIAIEVLSNPSVLFLDEPTSGLDSFTALNLVKLLKRLAKETGMTIICTIHQPRVAIYNLFDLLLLLGQGECVYYGPTSSSVDYFTRAGFPLPPQSNPADFYLDIVTPDNTSPSKAKRRQQQVENLIQHYRDSPERLTNLRKESEIATGLESTGDGSTTHAHRKMSKLMRRESEAMMLSMKLPVKANWFTQVYYLVFRSLINQMRDKQLIGIRLFSSILMGTVIGFTWFQLGNSQEDVYDRNGFLFFSVLHATFNEMNSVITSFPQERAIFLHDRASGTYRVSSYLASKFVADLPLHIIAPSIFAVIGYWLVGLNDNAKDFFIFLLTMILVGLSFASQALWLSATMKDAAGATASSTVLTIFFMVFGGFFITPDNIPDYFIWIHYISPVKYSFANMVKSQYDDYDKIKCPGRNNGRGAGAGTGGGGKNRDCVFENGHDAIKAVSADVTDVWQNFLILSAFVCFFTFLAYLSLRFLNRRR